LKLKILNAEPDSYSEEAARIISSCATLVQKRLDRAQLLRDIKDYDGLIVRLGHLVDRALLDAAPKLRFVATATTGLNHIDVEEAKKRGIEILCLKGERELLEGIYATPEHTWALILSLARNLPWAYEDVKGGNWRREDFRGFELADRTLGIVGYGRVGQRIAGYARAFGMNVLATDPHVQIKQPVGVKQAYLKQLLAEADVVCVCAALSPHTEKLLGASEFALMKPTAVLINTARGEILDESALLNALEGGKLKGAALDVLSGEYSGQDDWVTRDMLVKYSQRHKNLLITPHIGGATFDSMAKTEIFVARKIEGLCRM
jgi:D-3-phosphoglycerate dehydrogenase / 2-oxoglutarate reductase